MYSLHISTYDKEKTTTFSFLSFTNLFCISATKGLLHLQCDYIGATHPR